MAAGKSHGTEERRTKMKYVRRPPKQVAADTRVSMQIWAAAAFCTLRASCFVLRIFASVLSGEPN